MSSRKFKFVSPGVFLREIDNSQLPGVAQGVGPLIIGRTRKGPAMKPVKVQSYEEFVQFFGLPVPGAEKDDVWRDGNGLLATAYAPYAAKAYLKAKADLDSPVTVMRLLGVADASATDSGEPGWEARDPWGIFATHRDFVNGTAHTASLLGVVYGADTGQVLKVGFAGRDLHESASYTAAQSVQLSRSQAPFVRAASDDGKFTMVLSSSKGMETKTITFDSADTGNWIRKQLNTNPVSTNSSIMSSTGLDGTYWLGETFEEKYQELVRKHGAHAIVMTALKLNSSMSDFKSTSHGFEPAKTGWVIPQHFGASADFDPVNAEKLFRLVSLQEGEQGNRFVVKIENIRISEDDLNPYGRFDVVVYEVTNAGLDLRESWPNCNLNPNSDHFVASIIGDQHFVYNSTEKRNRVYGSFPNNSKYIRVETANQVGDTGPTRKASVPFGFLGPIVPADINGTFTAGKVAVNNWVKDTATVASGSTSKISFQWPGPQLLVTASAPAGGGRPYLGVTALELESSDEGVSESNSVDKGFQEYLRGLSAYSTHNADQKAGTATAGNTKHAHIFSLDNVILDPAPGMTINGDNMSEVALDRILHVEEAHSTVATAATLELTSTTTNFAHSDHFTVTVPASGSSVEEVVTIIFGDGAGTGNANKIRIRRDANGQTATATDLAQLLTFAINGTTPSGDQAGGSGAYVSGDVGFATSGRGTAGIDGLTATRAGTTVKLTSKAVSANGNNIVLTDTGGNPIASSAGASPKQLSGGVTGVDVGESLDAYTATHPASVLVRDVIDAFIMPMAGGMDGVDITEADPFNNSTRTLSGKTAKTSYAFATVDRALEIVKDAEMVEYNLATMPGITNTDLTKKLVENCEARGDSMALIDLPDVYIPPHEDKKTNFQKRVDVTNPTKSASALVKRQLNSSYGATYYPWVKIGEAASRVVWVPPSVVALGVLAHTEQKQEVWFAPAGFNRGGLSPTTCGLNVLGVSENLLAKDRDVLYDANINPIASFVTEGIVIFGQKTLQQTPSALDRINVRRLLIFVKRLVSRISNSLIFDQNLPATWNRFKGQVIPELESIKTRLGLSDFKVILDGSTTTPDLVDRNIMYAKIFLKPARAIEFIAVDFVITNTGASFDD